MLSGDLFKLGRIIVKNSGIVKKTGKPDIPRYLYHMTLKQNYEKMLSDGFIKTYPDYVIDELDGIFMFDLKNFEKRWSNTWFKVANKKVNLGSVLLSKHVSFGSNNDIVMLRIPTKNMDFNKMKIRRLDTTVFSAPDSAIYQSVYARRKIPIEYIYVSDINISEVQKLGEVSLKIRNNTELKSAMELKPFNILLKLFKGHPEEKGIIAHKSTQLKANYISW